MEISDLTHNKDEQQFYLTADGHKAFVDYILDDDQYRLIYSEVPKALRGQGIGRILVESTFDAIAAENKTAIAVCPYIKYVARSADKWQDVVSS